MADEPLDPRPVTRLDRKVSNAGMEIADFDHDRPEYLHALLCQVGLPRARTAAREFTRSAGAASLLVTAGKRYDGIRWVDCPLPYGTKPRLTLLHLCSEAVRTKSPHIDVSAGIKPFLASLGIQLSGQNWRSFLNQMGYLAASEMAFAWSSNGRITQTRVNPIETFSAWESRTETQHTFWPDQIELSPKFFETLVEHAVPLDPRAIHALQSSALAMDVYAWLAHRLYRVRRRDGVKLSWANLRDQFGHEYAASKDFKKEFRPALRKALCVYPDAHVSEEAGGIRLYASPPPIKKSTVTTLR